MRTLKPASWRTCCVPVPAPELTEAPLAGEGTLAGVGTEGLMDCLRPTRLWRGWPCVASANVGDLGTAAMAQSQCSRRASCGCPAHPTCIPFTYPYIQFPLTSRLILAPASFAHARECCRAAAAQQVPAAASITSPRAHIFLPSTLAAGTVRHTISGRTPPLIYNHQHAEEGKEQGRVWRWWRWPPQW